MKISIISRFCLFICVISVFGISAASSRRVEASMVNGSEGEFQGRDYILHHPASLSSEAKVPLVVVLHGGLGNAEGIQKELQLDALADSRGFMVAYLNGTGGRLAANMRTWNSGNCCGYAAKTNVNDVDFIDGVIADMVRKDNVDPRRIYMVGHSNGAMMSYQFVCERPNVVAAVVSISGSLTADRCNNTGKGLNVLEVHGQEDNNVPLAGGVGKRSVTRVSYRSVDQTGAELSRAGAKFNTMIVSGGGHGIKDLNSALAKNYSTSLAEVATQFIEDSAQSKKGKKR